MGKDTLEFQQTPQYVSHCIYYYFGNRIFAKIYLKEVLDRNSAGYAH